VKNVNELRDRIRATESVTNETFAQYLAIDSISSWSVSCHWRCTYWHL